MRHLLVDKFGFGDEPWVVDPVTELNDRLVRKAVRFLRTPKVQGTSKKRQTAFLSNKGLSEKEIERAYEFYALHRLQISQKYLKNTRQAKS